MAFHLQQASHIAFIGPKSPRKKCNKINQDEQIVLLAEGVRALLKVACITIFWTQGSYILGTSMYACRYVTFFFSQMLGALFQFVLAPVPQARVPKGKLVLPYYPSTIYTRYVYCCRTAGRCMYVLSY